MIKHVDEKASKSDQGNFDLQTTKNAAQITQSQPQSQQQQSSHQQAQQQSSHQSIAEQSFNQNNTGPFQNQNFEVTNIYKTDAFKSEIYRNEVLKSEFYNKELAQASMLYHRDLTQPENFTSQLIRFTQEKYPNNTKF